MEINCPNCKAPIDQEFGMSQCSNCSAVFFIDMDGNIAEDSAQDLSASAGTQNDPPDYNSNVDGVEQGEDLATDAKDSWGDTWQQEEENFSIEEISESVLEEEVPTESPWTEDVGNFIGEEELPEVPGEMWSSNENWDASTSEETSDEKNTDFGNDGLETEPEHDLVESISPTQHLAEIESYANSEESSGREGILFYDLELSGVDTNEDLQLIKEILSDKKLMINAKDVLDEKEAGRLFVKKLNPIKAAIIVQQLRNTSIEVNWRQYAINE